MTLYVLHLCLFLIHFLLQGLAYNSVWNDLVKTQAVSPCCNNAPACTTAYFRIHRLHLSESCHVDGTGKPASVSPYPACFDLANKYTCTRKNFGNNIMRYNFQMVAQSNICIHCIHSQPNECHPATLSSTCLCSMATSA